METDQDRSITDTTYQSVWDGLLEVSRARFYYEDRENSLSWRVKPLRFALALAGVGAMASLVEHFEQIGPIAGFAMTALVILDLLWNDTTRLAQLKLVNRDLAALETEYRDIWEKARNGTISDKEAQNSKQELLQNLNRITSDVDVMATKKTRKKIQEYAFKAEEKRYAG